MRAVIVDGYVDEPACLGVPPYISPYPRYIAGAMRERGLSESEITYVTIDGLRKDRRMLDGADIIVVIAGTSVPGKYLRAAPITYPEIKELDMRENVVFGGPVRLGFADEGGSFARKPAVRELSELDIEAYVYDMLGKEHEAAHRMRTTDEIARWAAAGAFIIRQHPDYPHVVCELETYRGCPRDAHCSFCTEPFYGSPDYRSVQDIVREVSALYGSGALYFRIGRQPDLFMYRAIDGSGGARPNPAAIESLYRGIRDAAPGLRVLHMDNANPATIYRFPEESLEIAKTIIKYHTPGDVAAFGMESADPDVIRANALKAEPDEVFESIRLLNKVGAGRGANGMPELLPGLNFVHGLRAESGRTFELNYEFLKRVLDSGLLLRRINIRQVMVFPETGMAGSGTRIKNDLFQRYKEKVRNDIDVPMLRRVVPAGTILRDVMTEVGNGVTYGRQLGSYPLLVGIPDRFPLGRLVDVVVTSHGSRSITGVPVPLNVNQASMKLISALPGIGKKRAAQVIRKRPFTGIDDFRKRVDGSSLAADYIGL